MEREKHGGLGRKGLRPQRSSTRDLASRWRALKPKVPIRSVQWKTKGEETGLRTMTEV